MSAKTSDWRPGPTVCRCCLSEGCYKDISTEYFWMGKREVYIEMLTETFDLNIAFSQTTGPNSNSRLICESCISRLRDATEFKRQVRDCEKTFLNYLDPSTSSIIEADEQLAELEKDVKLECVKEEALESDDDDDYMPPADMNDDEDDDDDDDLDNQPLTKLASKMPKTESLELSESEVSSKKTPSKRKSTIKLKETPPKKAKTKKDSTKATASKTVAKTEKKKKGSQQNQTENIIKIETNGIKLETLMSGQVGSEKEKNKYQRSARSEARRIIKKNASAILECWTVCPFRWKRNIFKCAYCDANFMECSLLRDHVRQCASQHTIKDIYSKYKEMSVINVDITQSVCSICTTPFTNISAMKEHVVQHGFQYDHKQPEGLIPFYLDKDSWQCVICQVNFNNFLKLYEHMNVHYQHYICSTCGKGFMTAPRLRKHSEVHITGSFPCSECDKVFTMRAARDYHKANSHAKAMRYECPFCNMRFRGYYGRMNHMNEAHRQKIVLYKCTHCELEFKTSGKRAIHVKTVHFPPRRDFCCSFCERNFKTGYELKRHLVKHTGEKNFHCSDCGKSFLRSRALKTHLKTHEDFTCHGCGIIYKDYNELLAHKQINHPYESTLEPEIVKL